MFSLFYFFPFFLFFSAKRSREVPEICSLFFIFPPFFLFSQLSVPERFLNMLSRIPKVSNAFVT